MESSGASKRPASEDIDQAGPKRIKIVIKEKLDKRVLGKSTNMIESQDGDDKAAPPAAGETISSQSSFKGPSLKINVKDTVAPRNNKVKDPIAPARSTRQSARLKKAEEDEFSSSSSENEGDREASMTLAQKVELEKRKMVNKIIRREQAKERKEAEKKAKAEAEAKAAAIKEQAMQRHALSAYKEAGKLQIHREVISLEGGVGCKVRYTVQNVPPATEALEVQRRLRSRDRVLDENPPAPSAFIKNDVNLVVWEEESQHGVWQYTCIVTHKDFFAGPVPALWDAMSIVIHRKPTTVEKRISVLMLNFPSRETFGDQIYEKLHLERMVQRATAVGPQLADKPTTATRLIGNPRFLSWTVQLGDDEILREEDEVQVLSVNQLMGRQPWSPTKLWYEM